MWLVPGKGRVVKRRCKIVICGMRLDEHPPWPRELPLLPHPRADTETNLSGAPGSCSLSPTCPRTVLGALRAADHLEILLICERSCQTEVSQALWAWQAQRVRLLCTSWQSLGSQNLPKQDGLSPEGPRAGDGLVWGGWFEPSSGQGLSSLLLALRREKGQHLGSKSTGDAKLKLA